MFTFNTRPKNSESCMFSIAAAASSCARAQTNQTWSLTRCNSATVLSYRLFVFNKTKAAVLARLRISRDDHVHEFAEWYKCGCQRLLVDLRIQATWSQRCRPTHEPFCAGKLNLLSRRHTRVVQWTCYHTDIQQGFLVIRNSVHDCEFVRHDLKLGANREVSVGES